MNKEIKKFYQSRTFWLAIVQMAMAMLGIILVHNPMLEGLAVVAIAKSILDITFRYLTTESITL